MNWQYGSYVPKEVSIEPLNADLRFKLYLRSTYTAPGIYIKTILFALKDQAHNTYPEWGDGIRRIRQKAWLSTGPIHHSKLGDVAWQRIARMGAALRSLSLHRVLATDEARDCQKFRDI